MINKTFLVNQLIKHEELRLTMYFDSRRIPTIGVGRNLKDHGITRNEALYLLNNDIDDVIIELSISIKWFDTLDEVRQRVLADLCFNLGIAGLLTFKTFLLYMESEKWDLAAFDLEGTLWSKQVGPTRTKNLTDMIKAGTPIAKI